MSFLQFPIDPNIFEIASLGKILMNNRLEYWHTHAYSLPWYIITVLPILFWILWWMVVDKNRLVEIAFYGLMVAFISSTLDEAGCMLIFWEYPYKVDPIFPRFISADFALLPVSYMLIYQRYTDWKAFFWISVLQSLIFSFILEPVIVKMGLYVLLNWSHAYSVLPYLLISVLCKWLINTLFKIEEKSRKIAR